MAVSVLVRYLLSVEAVSMRDLPRVSHYLGLPNERVAIRSAEVLLTGSV